MAAGDLIVYRENTGGETLGSSAANVSFDSEVIDTGGITITSGTDFTLPDAAPYLVLYNLSYETDGGTDRGKVLGNLELAGTDSAYGRSYGYLRRFDGCDEVHATGAGIIETSSTNEVLQLEAYDQDATGPLRMADRSGIAILQLNDSWDYFRARRTTAASATTSSFVDFNWSDAAGIDRHDTASFTHSTSTNPDEITLVNAGKYLFTVELSGTSAGGRANPEIRLALDGAELKYKRTSAYIRSAGDEAVVQMVGIIRTSTANTVLTVQYRHENSGAGTFTPAAGGASISIVALPERGEYCMLTGNTDQDATNTVPDDFEFTFQIECDGTFTHDTATANSHLVEVNEPGNYLFLATTYEQRQNLIGTLRYEPVRYWEFNASTIVSHGFASGFNRGNNASQDCNTSGCSHFCVAELDPGDTINAASFNTSTRTDTGDEYQAGFRGLEAVYLPSLFPAAGTTAVVDEAVCISETIAHDDGGVSHTGVEVVDECVNIAEDLVAAPAGGSVTAVLDEGLTVCEDIAHDDAGGSHTGVEFVDETVCIAESLSGGLSGSLAVVEDEEVSVVETVAAASTGALTAVQDEGVTICETVANDDDGEGDGGGGSGPDTTFVDETVCVSETLVGTSPTVAIVDEGVTVTEDIADAQSGTEAIDEGISVAENVTPLQVDTQVIDESVSLAEDVAGVPGETAAVDESVTLTEDTVGTIGNPGNFRTSFRAQAGGSSVAAAQAGHRSAQRAQAGEGA